jgi:hypothetical protein
MFIPPYLPARLFILLFLLLLQNIPEAMGQNLDQIGKGKALSFSGGISANQVLYGVNGIERRRNPYTYVLSANMSIGLYGLSMPFSFSYSNRQTSFQQPFNRYGLSPTYKWITAHIGYSSMSFSPYTLSGHSFLGAGLDLNPGEKFSFSMMYGRLQKAVEADTLNSRNIPAYRRMGYGFKAAYSHKGRFAELILFRAADDSTSLARHSEIKPEENLVIGLKGGLTIARRLALEAEWAVSAMNRDWRASERGANETGFFGYTGPFFTPTASSSYKQALKSALSYHTAFMNLSLSYECVEPGYRTLGAYYFNNDFESLALGASTQLFKKKLRLNTSLGLQRNNLDNDQLSKTERLAGSLSASWSASKKLNLNFSYSTFQTFTRIRSQFEESINHLTDFEQVDTLNFTQISKSANLSANYILSKAKERRQNLNMNFSYQQASDRQGSQQLNLGNQFYNLNTAYSLTMNPLTLTAAFNANFNSGKENSSSTLGPTLAAGRSFLDNLLRCRLSVSANNAYTKGQLTNRVFNTRLNGSYSIQKKHHLNLSLMTIRRKTSRQGEMQAFTEFTGTLGYSYNF